MKYRSLALVAIVFAWSAFAYADELPLDLVVVIDNHETVLDNLEGTLGEDGLFHGRGELEGTGFDVQWNFRGDIDPALSVGVSVTDVGAPSTFSFLFTLPVGSIPRRPSRAAPSAVPSPTAPETASRLPARAACPSTRRSSTETRFSPS
jgi:hypothetical protein